MPFFFLFLIILLSLFIAALCKNCTFRLIVLILLTILVAFETVSILWGGGYVNYQFYNNLDPSIILSGIQIFKLQSILVVLLFIVVIFVMNKIAIFLQKCCPLRRNVMISTILMGVLLIFFLNKNGPFVQFYEIYAVAHAPKKDFENALQNLGIDTEKYTFKPRLKAKAGKNIIVISMESLEQGFISSQYKKLTPNLTHLSKEYTFFKSMPMGTGSSWTIASLYTYMVGVPLLYGGYSPNPFEDVSSSELVSLGDILNKSGYNSLYIVGNPEFAGMGKAIRLFGIPVVSEKECDICYPDAPFGLYDKDLFELAKIKLTDLKKGKKPFALFLSTVSTHAPQGFYDERMESVIKKRKDKLEFAVASLDYSLGKFIDFLNQEDILKDTVIYIFPDHLLMGAGTPVIKHLSETKRQLYMITNANENELKKSPSQTIYQIDLPRLILNGADIETNATFLTDFLPSNVDKKAYIQKNKTKIASLNAAAMTLIDD